MAPEPTVVPPMGFDRFSAVLGAELDLDLSAGAPESSLRDELAFDSIAFIELVVFFADHGIELPDELVPELRTLGDVHHYYAALVTTGPAGADA